MTFSAKFDTVLHADCVSFVPGVREDEEVAVFSCYELDENLNKRLGRLVLAERHENGVEVIQTVNDLPGIFEFSWLPESQILITALAQGPPKLFKYEETAGNKELQELPMQSDANDLEMTLAVAGGPECLLTSDNKGILREWNIDNSSLQLIRCWQAHDAEIWYVSNDLWNKSLFFTGSDDYSMKIWDMREGSSNQPAAMAVNRTGHAAGVCCVASSPWDEFTIASGSYDEKVRLWDRRVLREPFNVLECGSGAWRVKWNPVNKNLISVAAMRAGFHVIDLEQGKIIQSESVDDHVAYGIDWHSNGISLASCSFYNNQGQFFSLKQ